jgi:hypothetical protein
MTLFISVFVGTIARSLPSEQLVTPIKATLIILLGISFVVGGVVQYDSTPEEPARYQDAKYINKNIPEEKKIGSFNSGIRQYYTPNHSVINLDGVVNVEAYRARSETRLSTYIKQNGICYLVIESWAHRLDLDRMNAEVIYRTNSTNYYTICDG